MTEPARTSPTANSPGTEVAKAPWVVTKPLVVELDAHVVEPCGAWDRADHQEQPACLHAGRPLPALVPPGERGKTDVALDRGQL